MQVVYQFNDDEAAELIAMYQKVIDKLPEHLCSTILATPSESDSEQMADSIREQIGELIRDTKVDDSHDLPVNGAEYTEPMSPELEEQLRDILKD